MPWSFLQALIPKGKEKRTRIESEENGESEANERSFRLGESGETNGHSKLTAAEVSEIRERRNDGEGIRELARLFKHRGGC